MASAYGVGEESFLSHVERVRSEIHTKFIRAHELLQAREADLLAELQRLINKYKGEGITLQIKELSISKEGLRNALKENENKIIFELSAAPIDARIKELETKLRTAKDSYKSVSLEWDVELDKRLSVAGEIRLNAVKEGIRDYKEIRDPVAVFGKHSEEGSSPGEFCYPQGIAINPLNNSIYICDGGYNRVQVYNKSFEFVFLFSGKMNAPIGICIKQNKIYVTQYDPHCLNVYYVDHNSKAQLISKLQTSIYRSKQYTTSQPYTDTSNKHQSITNKQTPIFPNWDTETSPDITTSISQYTPHNIPQPVAKQPTECKPIHGLKNLGNTCFMNCILQCLSHTIPLRHLYVSGDYKRYLGNRRGTLSFIFMKVMEDLWDTSSDLLAPHELNRQVGIVAPRFSGYNQHDAQEFMRFLLNELHDEINKASVKGRKSPADNETLESALERYLTWEDSKISDLFGGMLRSTVCCLVCRHTSTLYYSFMDLALPIPKKKNALPSSVHYYSLSCDATLLPAVQLSECLQIFTTEETLDEEERPYCARCKKLTKSTKQLEIAKLPSYLVIQLKRFSGYHVRTKLSTPVSFEDIWKLKDSDSTTHTYSLYGIVSHSGGIYGGHYVAYCKYKDVWRSFNDTMCRALSWEHVKQQEAYILFYEKED